MNIDPAQKVLRDKIKLLEKELKKARGTGNIKKKRGVELFDDDEKYKIIYDLSPDGIATITTAGIVDSVNDSFCKLTGYEKEDFIGKHITRVPTKVKPYGSTLIKMIKAIFAGKTKNPVQFEWKHKNGEIRIGEACVKLIKKNRKIVGLIGIVKDITESKRYKEELKNSEDKYKVIFENMNEAFSLCEIITDKNKKPINYTYIDVNPMFEKLTGLKKEKLIGKTVLDILPNTEKYWIEKLGEVAMGGEPLDYTNYEQKFDRYYRTKVFSPRKGYFAITFFDISEWKKAEQELLYERYLLHALLDNISDSIYFKDLQSRFIRINKMMAKMFGLDEPEQAYGKTDFDFFGEEHAKQAFKDEQQIIKTGKPLHNFEEKETWPDGRINWVSTTKMPLKDKNGKIVGTFGISRDITDQKKTAETLLEAKEKAEESDRLKSAFLANMSHEIRTPMNGIIGFSKLYINDDISHDKRNYYAQVVINSSNQLLTILDDILDISRIETGRINLNYEKVVVNDLIMDLFTFFNPQFNKKTISLIPYKELNDNESTIKTDKTRLRQILSNLLNNAFKFTREGYIKYGYELEKDDIRFFVEDTGIGISEKYHEIIFEPFRQVELEITRHSGGTGLGLSISKRLVELLGGNIWLKSEKGKGSAFYFTLPYKSVDKIVKQKRKEKVENEIKVKTDDFVILVAEDEEINYLYIEEVLSELDVKLLHARNGKEAVEIFKENSKINLVLMDIKMPVLNGYEAAKQIKKINPDIVIIAQTAYAMKEDKSKATEAGCDGYIAKPLDADELLNIIIPVLDRFAKTKMFRTGYTRKKQV